MTALAANGNYVVGNRTAMTDTSGVTSYLYDTLDRLTQVSTPQGVLGYGYDLAGNRTSITSPGSKTVTYTYDLAGRLTDVTDDANRVTHYVYDAAGRQTQVIFPNGVTQANIYDNADRLRSVVHTHASQGTIASAAYTLDQVGNRLTMVDLDGTTTYTYDKLHRLKTVAYPGGELVTYNYDAMGNRTSMVSSVAGSTSYSYDVADRLTSFTAPSGVTALTWDANGNMTGKGSASYSFDALDRLTRVVSATTAVQFSYNGDGVRVGKTVNGATTSYLQDTAAPLPVVAVETTGGQASRYIYGSDLLILVDPAGAPVFYHTDGLGSTRALSNQAGQRTDRYSYDVFGATRSHTGGSGQPFTYTGEQADGELGLVFLRARYYDPQVGRFVSKDPFAGLDTESQSLNRHVYAHNNPVKYTDPSGRFIPIIAAAIGVPIAVGAVIAFLANPEPVNAPSSQDQYLYKTQPFKPVVHVAESIALSKLFAPLHPGLLKGGLEGLLIGTQKGLLGMLLGQSIDDYLYGDGRVLNPYYLSGSQGGGGGGGGGGGAGGDGWGGPPSRGK